MLHSVAKVDLTIDVASFDSETYIDTLLLSRRGYKVAFAWVVGSRRPIWSRNGNLGMTLERSRSQEDSLDLGQVAVLVPYTRYFVSLLLTGW